MEAPWLPRDHPLAGCEGKLRRAHKNLELLDNEIGEYLDRKREPIPRVGQLDPKNELRVRWVVGPLDLLDLSVAALVGDYIHDLRSILDHIVFELAYLDTGGMIPSRRVAFPCCWTHKEWRSKSVRENKLGGVNRAHRAMIYRAQPCYRRHDSTAERRRIDRRRYSALGDLQDFWDHDKHRTLQDISMSPMHLHGEIVDVRDCRLTGTLHLERSVFGRPLKEGTTAFWHPIRPTGPKPEVEMEIQLAVHITFANGLPALETLAKLGNWVTAAFEAFAPEFETGEARRLWGTPRGGWIEDWPIRMRARLYRTEGGQRV